MRKNAIFGIIAVFLLCLTAGSVSANLPFEFYLEDDVVMSLEHDFGYDECKIKETSDSDKIYCDGDYLGEFEIGYEENNIYNNWGRAASYTREDYNSYIRYKMYSSSGKSKFVIKAYHDGRNRFYDAEGNSISERDFWPLWDNYVIYIAKRMHNAA